MFPNFFSSVARQFFWQCVYSWDEEHTTILLQCKAVVGKIALKIKFPVAIAAHDSANTSWPFFTTVYSWWSIEKIIVYWPEVVTGRGFKKGRTLPNNYSS